MQVVYLCVRKWQMTSMVMDITSVFDQRLSCSSQALTTHTWSQTGLECVAVLMSWTIKYTLGDQTNINLGCVAQWTVFHLALILAGTLGDKDTCKLFLSRLITGDFIWIHPGGATCWTSGGDCGGWVKTFLGDSCMLILMPSWWKYHHLGNIMAMML